ncbi:nuclear factor Y [Striga asiatica]|uniref:Nuclear factor Y n=1 Tax=Striga asiatica TaxID=4170 RepID=A0A5A7PB67_STRAF|nr:nuclear factor Y [Striga asiatica]
MIQGLVQWQRDDPPPQLPPASSVELHFLLNDDVDSGGRPADDACDRFVIWNPDDVIDGCRLSVPPAVRDDTNEAAGDAKLMVVDVSLRSICPRRQPLRLRLHRRRAVSPGAVAALFGFHGRGRWTGRFGNRNRVRDRSSAEPGVAGARGPVEEGDEFLELADSGVGSCPVVSGGDLVGGCRRKQSDEFLDAPQAGGPRLTGVGHFHFRRQASTRPPLERERGGENLRDDKRESQKHICIVHFLSLTGSPSNKRANDIDARGIQSIDRGLKLEVVGTSEQVGGIDVGK